MIPSEISPHIQTFALKNFELWTIKVNSQVLKKNPLKDPATRFNVCLVPKSRKSNEELPVVLVLAGFTGTGNKYLNIRFMESNYAQVLDLAISNGEAPRAVYVFVDAITFWGGSQFINSTGTGNYENYLTEEVYPAICQNLPVTQESDGWCVMGGSSGGYGALHLVSKHPNKFGLAAAIAPDSFFEGSLLPEIFSTLFYLNKYESVKGIRQEILDNDFMNQRNAHTVLNAIGMGTCYAPDSRKKGEVIWPVDRDTGVLNGEIWKEWLAHDPIYFLPKRKASLSKVRGIYLDVGDRDQYNLQYGARQIREILKDLGVRHKYSEFRGGHFDISKRRAQAWKWLNRYFS